MAGRDGMVEGRCGFRGGGKVEFCGVLVVVLPEQSTDPTQGLRYPSQALAPSLFVYIDPGPIIASISVSIFLDYHWHNCVPYLPGAIHTLSTLCMVDHTAKNACMQSLPHSTVSNR